MASNIEVIHAIPGRIRISVPHLQYIDDHRALKAMFESLKGIEHVRIEPIIQTMVIKYKPERLEWQELLKATDFLLTQRFQAISVKPAKRRRDDLKKDILRSCISGILLLFALWRKKGKTAPDILDYLTVIATSYTVLSHGENRLTHPDVLTGIISIALTGTENILRVAFVTWIVNLAEVINDIRKGAVMPFSI